MAGKGEAGEGEEANDVREAKNKTTKALIIDSSGLFHLRNAYIFYEIANSGYKLITTSQVVNEVKDIRSQALLNLLNPEVINVNQGDVEAIKMRNPELSDADASIVALAVDMATNGIEVAVLTDDTGLMKALRRRIRGIRIITVNVK